MEAGMTDKRFFSNPYTGGHHIRLVFVLDHATVDLADVVHGVRNTDALLVLVPFHAVGRIRTTPFQHLELAAVRTRHVIPALITFQIRFLDPAFALDRGRTADNDFAIPERL